MYISFKLGCNFNSCCYSVFSTDFPIPSFWTVFYIIQIPLDDLSLSFVDRPSHYLSACPIKHLPKPLVSCDSQDNIVQGFSPHKCSQKVWWDALNVVAATISLVTLGLTSSSKLLLYNITSYGNVPLTRPYCLRV